MTPYGGNSDETMETFYFIASVFSSKVTLDCESIKLNDAIENGLRELKYFLKMIRNLIQFSQHDPLISTLSRLNENLRNCVTYA